MLTTVAVDIFIDFRKIAPADYFIRSPTVLTIPCSSGKEPDLSLE
jgi:hypothetical protein